MAAVRRSARLSNAGKSAPPTRSTRRLSCKQSDIWQHRASVDAAVSSDDDDDDHEDGKERSASDCETEENNENCNVANKMEGGTRTRKAGELEEDEQMRTPRRKGTSRSVAVSRKPGVKRQTSTKGHADRSDEASDGIEIDAEASPPKQGRLQKPTLSHHLISPSRILDRLSIEEAAPQTQSEDEGDTSEETEKQTPPKATASSCNKYQSARRVLNSAETQKLPGREEQLRELRAFFSEHLESQRSGSLYVSGQPGTGKTACLSLLLHSPEFARRMQRVYVNCTSVASIGGVYKKLCTELELHPQGRTERDCLAALQHHIRTCSRMLLIVLDEIDQLCTSRQSVLYTIFEWPAIADSRLLLVGIANSLDLTERALMRLNARCELKPRHMHFPPYSKQQIIDIFRSRLEEAEVLDVFPPVTLQLLAAKVSAVSGDVRRALDIGRRVVEIAEQQKKAGQREVTLRTLDIDGCGKGVEAEETMKPVQVAQVAAVLNKVYGASQNLEEDIEESFPLQQKIMLCSLMLMLRKERNKDINLGRLHEVYRRVCTKRNIHPVDQAEFAGLVDLVETRGILRLVKKKEPRLSKVQLQWDEEEVNAALSDKQLISSILDDTACLGK